MALDTPFTWCTLNRLANRHTQKPKPCEEAAKPSTRHKLCWIWVSAWSERRIRGMIGEPPHGENGNPILISTIRMDRVSQWWPGMVWAKSRSAEEYARQDWLGGGDTQNTEDVRAWAIRGATKHGSCRKPGNGGLGVNGAKEREILTKVAKGTKRCQP